MAAQAEPVFAQSSGSSEQDVLQQIDDYNNQGGSNSVGEMNQVNSVFQLEDVSPDDWAFESLRNLVERYGCIAGYPDGTFRGNESMTRYEFAAGLNACLQQIEQLIASQESDVSQEDLEALQRLTEEFEAELATLGTRVDNLEGRVGFLEDNQFSTTTKLTGGFNVAMVFPFGDDKADGSGESVDENVGLVYQGQLNFDSSFTGRDLLRVQLRAAEIGADGGGFQQTATGEPLTELFDIFDPRIEGDIILNELSYTFPVGDRIEVALGASGASAFPPDKIFESNFGSGGNLNDLILQGDLDTRQGGGRTIDIGSPGQLGAGISTRFDLTDRISFGAGYTVDQDKARDEEIGLFQEYSVAANLNYAGDNFDVGVNYGRTRAGTAPSNDITHDAVGLSGGIRFSPRTEVGGWATYVDQSSFDTDRDGFAFGANLSLFDLGKEGSKLALGLASPAFFSDFDGSGLTNFVDEADRAYVAELSYAYPINDNISIAPGLTAVFNPLRDSDNDTVYTGVIQTTFSF